MNKSIYFVGILFLFSQCKNGIKNEESQVIVEAGTEVMEREPVADSVIETDTVTVIPMSQDSLYGFWIGYFEKDKDPYDIDSDRDLHGEKGDVWTRENKINISIDEINDGKVIGHSVVAGNDRPFEGTVKEDAGGFNFEVKEPGDNKYDGTFTFRIANNKLQGKWRAYKKIDISKRKYSLEKTTFEYRPDVMLEPSTRYVEWDKFIEEQEALYGEEIYTDGEFYGGATKKIYKLNASNGLLTEDDVQYLTRGDLLIIRNAIYARHGYSFKNRSLRVFFDAQSWYIPVHANIQDDFTKIEKDNIELLLRYEKYNSDYYDAFGR